jgi:hypothetical protein
MTTTVTTRNPAARRPARKATRTEAREAVQRAVQQSMDRRDNGGETGHSGTR